MLSSLINRHLDNAVLWAPHNPSRGAISLTLSYKWCNRDSEQSWKCSRWQPVSWIKALGYKCWALSTCPCGKVGEECNERQSHLCPAYSKPIEKYTKKSDDSIGSVTSNKYHPVPGRRAIGSQSSYRSAGFLRDGGWGRWILGPPSATHSTYHSPLLKGKGWETVKGRWAEVWFQLKFSHKNKRMRRGPNCPHCYFACSFVFN